MIFRIITPENLLNKVSEDISKKCELMSHKVIIARQSHFGKCSKAPNMNKMIPNKKHPHR